MLKALVCFSLIVSGCSTSRDKNLLGNLPNSKIVSLETYKPEDHSSLTSVFYLSRTPLEYQECLDRNKKLGYEFYDLTYLSEGYKVKAILALPQKSGTTKIPLVVAVRGGRLDYGRWTACNLRQVANLFGGQGQRAVLAVQLREAAGGEGRDEFGGAEVQDVLVALEIGKSLPQVDAKNVFLTGWSRGGMEVLLALRSGAKVNAAISVAGISDMEDVLKRSPEFRTDLLKIIPEFKDKEDEIVISRSALRWAQEISAPLLIIHGSADTEVPVYQSRRLAKKLKNLGKAYRYVEYPKEGHLLEGVFWKISREFERWITEHSLTSTP